MPAIPGSVTIGLGVLAIMLGTGWYHTNNLYVSYKATVQQAAADQKRDSDAKDKLAKENADDKQSEFVDVIKRQDGYYRDHPVIRVQYADGKCSVSSAAGNSKGPDAAPSAPDAATQYVSPYSPQDTERVAAQLDQLQKLLTIDGVKVE